MGRLSLNKKYITNIRASASGSDAHIFLGGNNNTIETFLSSAETTFGASGTGTQIIIYNPINGIYSSYLRRTATSWRDGNNTIINTLIINDGAIFYIISPTITRDFTMQGTNLVQKYGNISRTIIKKTNVGGGRLLSPKLNQRIIPYFIIIESGLAYYDNGNSVTVSAGNSIRFFTSSTTSGLRTRVNASGSIVAGFTSTFIDLFYPNGGTYFITLTQPGDAFYKSATLTITVLVALVVSESSGGGIGGGGI